MKLRLFAGLATCKKAALQALRKISHRLFNGGMIGGAQQNRLTLGARTVTAKNT
jgi:hypothetical protein